MLWVLREVLYNHYLIDGLYVWTVFVVSSAAVSCRHDRTGVISLRLYCTMYTHNMAAATLNLANDNVTLSIL